MRKRGIGITLIVLGIATLLINSFNPITGFVIAEKTGNFTSSILALVLIVIGIVLATAPTLERQVAVRHYTTNSRAQRIAEAHQFGGQGMTLDQGGVFVERVTGGKKKPLSAADFRRRYAIPAGKKGLGYVEFSVPEGDLEVRKNPRTGRDEYFLRATDSEGGSPVYYVNSRITPVRRR
jgi:hypothetical protein